MSNRDERGVGTILGLTMIALLTMFALVAAGVMSIVDAHRRAQAAADLAALAGAQGRAAGRDPCAAAALVAGRNGARLTSCRLDGADVLVEVAVSAARPLHLRGPLPARARAGPVQAVSVAPNVPP